MIMAPDDAVRALANTTPEPLARPGLVAPSPLLSDLPTSPGAQSVWAHHLADDLTGETRNRGLGDAFSHGYMRAQTLDNLTADDTAMAWAYDPIVDAVNRDRPWDQAVLNPYSGEEDGPKGMMLRTHTGQPGERHQSEDWVFSQLAQLRQRNPGLAANLPKDRAELLAHVQSERQQLLAYDADLAENGSITQRGASFLGSLWGGVTDPPNIAAMLVGAPAGASLLKTFVIEGGLNVAVDAVGLPSRRQRYAALGQEMSAGDLAAELGGDFLMGGSIAAGFRGLHALWARYRHADMPPDVRTASTVTEDALDRAERNPHAPDAEGIDLTRRNAGIAMGALDRGALDDLPDTTASVVRGAQLDIEAAQRRAGFSVETFDPREIGTDAATMQYKAGADAAGVTDRLAGVEHWDPVKAGLSLIYEREDGRLIAADGHQRLGLAKRIGDAQGAPVAFAGVRLREADGITPQQVRAIAALKNIAEGSGTAVDAARVLRDAPEGIKQLPPRSPLVRHAKDLAALGDDAWGMAINGHAGERDAGLVGRHVRDPTMQAAILHHLAADSPDTAEEAELFIRQALAAGAHREVQTDMFGSFLKADLVLPARVKILKAALTSLRKDRALFGTLTDKAGAIEGAGNVLNPAENAARQETATRAFAMLKALAERKGPISDALQAAAERSLKGDRAAATRDFLATVRGAVERGELDGGGAGEPVGDVEPQTEASSVSGQDQQADVRGLDLFGDPDGKPAALLAQADALAHELAQETAPTDAALEHKEPFDMSVEQLDRAIADEQLGDHARLVRALGSETAAKEFERLDRARNSAFDPARADAAAAEFDSKFGNLSKSQERLIYGSTDDLSAEDLQAIRAARAYDTEMPAMSDEQIARVLSRGMLDVTPEQTRAFLAARRAPAREQAAIIRVQSSLEELNSRGLAQADIGRLIAGAMEARGYDGKASAEVLEDWLAVTARKGKRGPGSASPQLKALAAPAEGKPEFGPAQAQIEDLRAMPQYAQIPAGDLFGHLPESSVNLKTARIEIERQARAVEMLRRCIEGTG